MFLVKDNSVGEDIALAAVDCVTCEWLEIRGGAGIARSDKGGGMGIESLLRRDLFFSSSSVSKVRLD